MRHPILCVFLTLVLTFTTAQPFVGLNAAELWNSQKKKGKTETIYNYNNPKSSGKGGITLYNRKNQQSYSSNLGGGLKATLDGYKKVQYSGQHPSKLWKFMSASALENRQADIDNALQIEYETRKKTAKLMVDVFKEVKEAQIKSAQKYQEELAEYEALKAAEELEKQKKKEYALNGGKNYKSKSKGKSKNYISKNSGKKKLYNRTASGSKQTTIQLKKPKKLFNSPNR